MPGQDEAFTRRLWRRTKSFVVEKKAAVLFCTLLVGVALLAACLFSTPAPHYVLVLDSGSTGTRIYAYVWRDRFRQLPLLEAVPVKTAGSKVPRRQAGDRRAYERVETEPGLDHYIKDSKGLVEKALSPLLEWAEEVVPRSRWRSTPIFLFATAGLRKLPAEHQENILDTVRHILGACPFRFEPAWARMINGEQEGVYGWVALNYLTGYLSPHPFSATKAASVDTDAESALDALKGGETVAAASQGLRTVGALDLGGSSLEVTFVPSKLTPETIKANVSILGVTYSLFTHAHQRYGLNDAFDRSVSILLDGPALKDEKNAVWAEYSEGLRAATAQQVRPLERAKAANEKPLVLGRHEEVINVRRLGELGEVGVGSSEGLPRLNHPCLQSGYAKAYKRLIYEGVPTPARVELVGKPNWEACEELAAYVVNASQPCLQSPCALGQPQPVSDHPMFALTGFHVVYHFFGLPPSASLADLAAKGQRFCDTEWAAIAAKRGSEVHVEHYCFRVPYMIGLLRKGLGVPESRIQLGSGREPWTLGAALAEGARAGAGRSQGSVILSRTAAMVASAALFLCWLVFLGWTLKSSGAPPLSFDRKASGATIGSRPSKLPSRSHPLHGSAANSASRNNLAQAAAPTPAPCQSPTAVIGGSNFNSSMARLAGQASQRKRINSIDDLQSLR